MLNDLISDGLTRIRNASMRKLETAKLLHSKVVEATLSILAAKGYVESYNVIEDGTVIVSTSKGVMSGIEASKAGVGGEVLCTVW